MYVRFITRRTNKTDFLPGNGSRFLPSGPNMDINPFMPSVQRGQIHEEHNGPCHRSQRPVPDKQPAFRSIATGGATPESNPDM
jgi:hypothetical protein